LNEEIKEGSDRDEVVDMPVDLPLKKRKTTKKGIMITAIIVTAIIGASFLVYFIP
jgi:hypothetical protein